MIISVYPGMTHLLPGVLNILPPGQSGKKEAHWVDGGLFDTDWV